MKYEKVNWNCEEVNLKRRISHIKLDVSHLKHGKVNSLCGKVNLKLDISIRLRRGFGGTGGRFIYDL
jgi:hypothetical protein